MHVYNAFSTLEQLFINNTPEFHGNYDYEFTVPNTAHPIKGEYSHVVFCNTTENLGGFHRQFYFVTNSGLDPAEGIFEFLIYLLFIISTITLFLYFFITVVKTATVTQNVYGVLISWASLILMIIVNYLGKEYLLRTFVEDLSGSFISIAAWTNGVLPVIALVLTIFVRSTQKKNNLTIKEFTGGKLLRYG